MIFKQIQDQVIETFNTHRMKDNVIEALMTGRTGERDQILGVIEANLKAPSGSVQHMIVYAPRGFGKSFLIRMVQIEAEKKATEGAPLAFVLLPEEQHNLIRSPSTLLDYVAMKIEDRRTGSDQSWAGAMFQWPDPERIKTDWEKAEKGLDEALDRYLAGREGLAVVVVENFDILMSTAFKSKPEEQILRRWMTRRGSRFMLLATATGSVDLDYDRPLFQAFRSVRLQPWTSDDCIDYFNRRRIFIGGQPLSPAEETKARAVSDFIGGTPRLAQLLAEVLDADAGFEKGEPLAVVFVMNQLADKLADYYRNRMNDLPPLAQGLLDALIRGGEPCSATDLAKRVGADGQNVVARTMNDLQRADMIRGLPAPDGREKLFRVVDRVFVHFYRLRQGHAQTIDSPLATILEFLRAFYTPLEHKHQALRFLDAGHPAEADIFARLGCEEQALGRGYSSYRIKFLYRLTKYLQIAPGAWHTTAEEIERDLQSPAHVIQQGKKEPLHASPLEMAIRSAIIAQAYTRMDLLDKALEVLTTAYQETKQDPEAAIVTAYELSIFFSLEKANNDNALKWAIIAGEQQEGPIAPFLRLKAIFSNEWSLGMLNRHEEAFEAAQKALDLAQKGGDKLEQAVAIRHIAFSLGALGRHEEAIDAALKAAGLAHETGDKHIQTAAMRHIAFSLGALGRYKEAIETALKAVGLAQETGDKREQAVAMRHKAFSLGALGRHEEAIDAALKAARLAQEAGDKREQAVAMRHKAFSFGALNRHIEAIETAKLASSLAEEASDWYEMTLAHSETMLESLKTVGRLPEAIDLAADLCDKVMAADEQTIVFKTTPHLLRMGREIPCPEAMILFARWTEAVKRNTNAKHSGSLSNRPWMPQYLLPDFLATATRARAWKKLDYFLAKHVSWFSSHLTTAFYLDWSAVGIAITRVGSDEGRASGFDAAQGILSRLAKLVRESTDEGLRTTWLTSIFSAFAKNCRDAGLLRDVAGLLTEDLSPDGPSQARLLEYLADYEAAGDSRPGVLARMDPDVALWIRRIRGLPDESLILPKKRKRKK